MSCWQCNCCDKPFLEVGWCPRDPDQACGWPAKTIRSILALLVVGLAIIAALVVLIFLSIEREWEIAIGVVGTLLSIATGVLGYYFGFRSGSSQFSREPLESKESLEESEESV